MFATWTVLEDGEAGSATMTGVGAAVGASGIVDADDVDTGVVAPGVVRPGVDCTSGVTDAVSTTTWLAATVTFVSGLSAAAEDDADELAAEFTDVDDDPWGLDVSSRVVRSLSEVSAPPDVAVDACEVLSSDEPWDVDVSSVAVEDDWPAVVPAVPDAGVLVCAPPVLIT
jgi:hypothetical protein